MLLRNKTFQKLVVSLVSGTMLSTTALPLYAAGAPSTQYYDTLIDPNTSDADKRGQVVNIGKEANQFGKDIGAQGASQAENNQLQDLGTDFSFNEKDKNEERWIKFSVDQSTVEKMKGDPGKIEEKGGEKKEWYAENSASNPVDQDDQSNTPAELMVYQVLREKRAAEQRGNEELAKVDENGKRPLDMSEAILDNPEDMFGNLVSCSTSSDVVQIPEKVHIPDYQTCEQIDDMTNDCKIRHWYDVKRNPGEPFDVVRNASTYAAASRIETVKIASIYVKRPVYDGYLSFSTELCGCCSGQVWIQVNGHRYNVQSLITGDKGNRYTPNINWIVQNANVGSTIYVYYDSDCGSCHTKHPLIHDIDLRIKIWKYGTVTDNEWSPPDCFKKVLAIRDGFATGNVWCSRMPRILNGGCALVNDAVVCLDQFHESPLAQEGISPYCQEVSVSAKSEYFKGESCYDAQEVVDGKLVTKTICTDASMGYELDQCKELQEQNCQFISSKCSDGGMGASGTCYVNEVSYDCGTDHWVTKDMIMSSTDCKGMACLGEECIDVEREQSTDFARVAAILQAAQLMSQDIACTGLDPRGFSEFEDSNVDCVIFGGYDQRCKRRLAGVFNCCKKPKSYLKGNFLKTALGLIGLGALGGPSMPGANPGELTNTLTGSYSSSRSEGTSFLNKPFATQTDNLQTSGLNQQEEGQSSLDKIQKNIGNGMNKMMESVGLSSGDNGNFATDMMMGGMSAMSSVSNIVSLANPLTLLGMFFGCEKKDVDLKTKRDMKLCHEIGTYCSRKINVGFAKICVTKTTTFCCFQSPMARILMEQIRAKNPHIPNNTWGSAESPNCSGINARDIDKINWDEIDLTEWTNLLNVNDAQLKASQISMDRATGNLSWQNYDDSNPRKNTLERTEEKLNQIDVDGASEEARRCLTVDMGGGYQAGGLCNQAVDRINRNGLECLKNGKMIDCNDIRYLNDLNALRRQTMNSTQMAARGYECFNNGVSYDCTKINSTRDSYIRALHTYASDLGGDVWGDRYICYAKNGDRSKNACEQVRYHNKCSESTSNYVCLDGNQTTSCANLGGDPNRPWCPKPCECCIEECYKYENNPRCSIVIPNPNWCCGSGCAE